MSKFFVNSKKVSKKFLHRHYPVLKNHPLPSSQRVISSFFLLVKCLLVVFLFLKLQIWNFECSLSFLNLLPSWETSFFSVNILVCNQKTCGFCWFRRNCSWTSKVFTTVIILKTYQFYSNIFWVARNLIVSNFIHFGQIWSKKIW